MRARIVCVAVHAPRIRCEQMGLAGSVPLRQYVPSMLTRRSRSSRSSTRAGAGGGASHHLLSLSGIGAFLALFAQGLASCGDDSGGDACEPGDLRACALAGETCAAVQTCNADGSGYSACACPDGSGSGGSAGSGAGSGGGGSSNAGAAGAGGGGTIDPIFNAVDRVMGAPCTSDAECPQGPDGESLLTCILPTSSVEFGAGSPQGGYCTARCRATTDCQALDGLSACGLLDDAGDGYCIGLCEPGPDLADRPAVKCNTNVARAQACFQINENGVGACFPVCQSDAACGAGTFCDFGATGLGLCVTTQPVGGEIGAPCTRETAETDCRSGTCVTLINPETGVDIGAFCSANCTFGLLEGCGFAAEEAAGARDAVCIQSQLENGAAGDVGFCFELCNEDTDCTQAGAGWVCSEFSANIQTIVGRVGECVPPELANGDGGVVVDAGN
jgi:hypothetical protein